MRESLASGLCSSVNFKPCVLPQSEEENTNLSVSYYVPLFSIQSSHKLLEQMEGKNSTLKEDIVSLKEGLNKATLEKEVLDQEKAEISESRKLEFLFEKEK